MVLFPAGPVLPADGCAEAELADVLFSVIGSNAIFVYMWAELCPPRAIFPACCLPGSASASGMRTGLSLFVQLRPDLGRAVLHVQKPDLHQGLGLFSALRS